ncbi:MAG TPA: Rieske 2Fe-2S domain-containing protein [Burkholderiaceae bacterium]|nr:Rieske 2Fe-2S domain-containing protein [Burkholderiaceae bacterium]
MADAGLMRPGLIRVCESAALTDGGDGVRFSVTPQRNGPTAFAVRNRGRVFGYLNRCAHTGLELDWTEGRFLDSERRWLICAAHGALYEPVTGACAGGPCTGRGALVPLALVEIDGVVYWRPDRGEPTA